MEKKAFIPLADLEVYKLAREFSSKAWIIYESMSWQDKKVIGDQFITSADSIGANIAEGYFRHHFLDKIKFYYISRASLAEASEHWLGLLFERNKISKETYDDMKDLAIRISIKLNNFISSTYHSKNNR